MTATATPVADAKPKGEVKADPKLTVEKPEKQLFVAVLAGLDSTVRLAKKSDTVGVDAGQAMPFSHARKIVLDFIRDEHEKYLVANRRLNLLRKADVTK